MSSRYRPDAHSARNYVSTFEAEGMGKATGADSARSSTHDLESGTAVSIGDQQPRHRG